ELSSTSPRACPMADKTVVPLRPPPLEESVSPEERARCLRELVEKWAKMSSTEWMYYIERGDVAKQYNIEPAKLREMVEATIQENEKKAREAKVEEQRREQRAERERTNARKEQERQQREQRRAQKEADKEAEKRQRERGEELAAIFKLPSVEHEPRLAALA